MSLESQVFFFARDQCVVGDCYKTPKQDMYIEFINHQSANGVAKNESAKRDVFYRVFASTYATMYNYRDGFYVPNVFLRRPKGIHQYYGITTRGMAEGQTSKKTTSNVKGITIARSNARDRGDPIGDPVWEVKEDERMRNKPIYRPRSDILKQGMRDPLMVCAANRGLSMDEHKRLLGQYSSIGELISAAQQGGKTKEEIDLLNRSYNSSCDDIISRYNSSCVDIFLACGKRPPEINGQLWTISSDEKRYINRKLTMDEENALAMKDAQDKIIGSGNMSIQPINDQYSNNQPINDQYTSNQTINNHMPTDRPIIDGTTSSQPVNNQPINNQYIGSQTINNSPTSAIPNRKVIPTLKVILVHSNRPSNTPMPMRIVTIPRKNDIKELSFEEKAKQKDEMIMERGKKLSEMGQKICDSMKQSNVGQSGLSHGNININITMLVMRE